MPMDAHLQKAFDAVERGDHAALTRVLPLIRDVETLHASRETDGFSLATLAASKGHLLALGALKARGVDFTRPDANHETPLHATVRSDSEASLSVLRLMTAWTRAAGANLEAADHMGDSALLVAVDEARLDKMNVLIGAGASLETATPFGETPLHRAAWSGHVGAVRALLEAGAPVTVRNGERATPLHAAMEGWDTDALVSSGHGAIVKLLCAQGADPTLPDDTGVSPLHMAAMQSTGEPLRLLLAYTPQGWAPDPKVLDLAIHGRSVDVLKSLVERGVEFPARLRTPELSEAALATAHAELVRSRRPECQLFAAELVCPVTGIPFGLAGGGRPVQVPRTTTVTVFAPPRPPRSVTLRPGDVVRADTMKDSLATHPDQTAVDQFRASTAFQEGVRERIARLEAVEQVYRGGRPVAQRAEEARLRAETVSGPPYARVAAQWALATLNGGRGDHTQHAVSGSPHSASTRSSSPSLSSPAL